MNIIFVAPALKTGGGNRVFVELANQLCVDHNVHIVAPYNSPDKHNFELNEYISIDLIGRLAFGKVNKLFNVFKTIKYLTRNHRKDIVISSDPIFSIFLFFAKCEKKYRFIQADDYRIFDDGAILGCGILLKMYKKLCLISYKNKHIKFIFNSQYVYEQYCKDSKRTDIPYLLVHPALNLDIFNAKGRNDLSTEKISLCLVARKHPLKGIVNFINVWRRLEPEYKEKVKEVVMVSHDNLSCFDTTDITIIKPNTDRDISAAYCAADIFISTSWWEGFGLPPLEAMACGCTVICSYAGGVNEYARPNENCLMFEPKNETALKECLIHLIEDVKLRKRLSSKALETVKYFTWQNSSKQLLNIIEKQ